MPWSMQKRMRHDFQAKMSLEILLNSIKSVMTYYNIASAVLAHFFEDLNVLPAVFSYLFTIAYPLHKSSLIKHKMKLFISKIE